VSLQEFDLAGERVAAGSRCWLARLIDTAARIRYSTAGIARASRPNESDVGGHVNLPAGGHDRRAILPRYVLSWSERRVRHFYDAFAGPATSVIGLALSASPVCRQELIFEGRRMERPRAGGRGQSDRRSAASSPGDDLARRCCGWWAHALAVAMTANTVSDIEK